MIPDTTIPPSAPRLRGAGSASPHARGAQTGSTAFRPDIQGLRAVAVLSVIAAHAAVSGLAGGFVGVDVFFVISGYLITQQLLREAARDGRVSLLGFYARRARRILPAATLVLVATVAMTAWRLGSAQTATVVTDAIWSSCFLANVHFAQQGTDYFAQSLPPSPLQHFWSLSVEEQFYLAWPLLILGCLLLARLRRRLRGRTPAADWPTTVTVVLGALVAASLAWSWWATSHSPQTAYFSTLARAWELGLGAVGAVVVTRVRKDALPPWAAQAATLLGAVMIGWTFASYDGGTPFPGTAALLPVLGSALVIVGGALAQGPTAVGRVLAVAPLRRVGDWSYSLYLWHFPLLVIPEVRAGHELDGTTRLGLVALAIVLSALSYEFVETPFRTGRLWRIRWRAVVLYPLSVVLVVALGAAGNAYTRHVDATRGHHPAITLPADWRKHATGEGKHRSVALLRESVRAAKEDRPIPTDLSPDPADLADSYAYLGECDYATTGSTELCVRGDPHGSRTMVVLGNSHARHWVPALDKIAERAHLKTYYLARSQCPAAMITPDVAHETQPDTDCADFHTWAVEQIKRLHPDLLVISSSQNFGAIHTDDGVRHSSTDEVRKLEYQGYLDMLDLVVPAAKRTVWIRDIPSVPGASDPGTCLAVHRTLGACAFRTNDKQQAEADLQMRAARARGVKTVDMDDWFCWRGLCPSVVGDTIVRRDFAHITNEYSARLAAPLGRKLGLW